jgi:hypothetical protein
MNFLQQHRSKGAISKVELGENQQPVLGFIRFLDRDSHLGFRLAWRSAAAARTVIGSHRSAGLQQLSAKYIALDRVRQRPAESDDRDRERESAASKNLGPFHSTRSCITDAQFSGAMKSTGYPTTDLGQLQFARHLNAVTIAEIGYVAK